MKNFLFGAVFALVIAGAVVAGIYYIPPLLRPAPPPPPPPSQVAQSIKPGFVGKRLIGGWLLACHRIRRIPNRVAVEGVTYGTRIIGGSPGEASGSVIHEAPIPMRPCRVLVSLRDPHDPDEFVNPMFVLFGPGKGVLNLAIHLSSDLVPNPPKPQLASGVIPGRNASSPTMRQAPPPPVLGDSLELQLSSGNVKIPVRTCTAEFCLAIRSILPGEEKEFLSSKKFVLVLPTQKGKRIALNISADGLALAVATMRRMAAAAAKS
ncbi:MAG TPA: hypothetical protein VGL35_10935 [Rhizomicrobium sp.]|jgi:hypothetical protein